MKIGQKITLGFLGVILFIGIIGIVAIHNDKEIIKNGTLSHAGTIEKYFLTLQERDTKILSSCLEVFVQNQVFKDLYLEKNREKLYKYAQPLFETLKREYGITHFYFILPDGHCFLRLHNKDIYGDLITRPSFAEARDTKQTAAGIELGKTAFALRVVRPYYNGEELIGYVELGEEIDHFLKILKGDTNNEFSIFCEKDYLDKEDWKSAKKVAGLRDNWNDLDKHVLAGSTNELMIEGRKELFSEENIGRLEKGEKSLGQARIGGRNFALGGFVIRDIKGRHAGMIFSLLDLSEVLAIAKKSNSSILLVTAILIIIALVMSFFISNSISVPIAKLRSAMIKVGKGELDTEIEISSKDEIGELAISFKKMVEDFKNSTTSIASLNHEIAERKKAEEALSIRNNESEQMNKVVVGRELKMIELKKEIEELKKKA